MKKPEKIKPPVGIRVREDHIATELTTKRLFNSGADAVLSLGKDGMKLEFKHDNSAK